MRSLPARPALSTGELWAAPAGVQRPGRGASASSRPVAVLMENGALCARHGSGARGRAPPQELPAGTGRHAGQQKGWTTVAARWCSMYRCIRPCRGF